MKHVDKGGAPQAFEDWKASATENWTPNYADLRGLDKAALHNALLNEQGYVCCYCGRDIDLNESHIEHFRPQGTRPDLALDYDNLLASCIGERKRGTPLHCGHAKGNTFNEMSYISPLEPGCEDRFEYTPEGKIKPTDPNDKPAKSMLLLLKLDVAFLNNRRADVIQRVFSDDEQLVLTVDDLQKLRDFYRRNDAGGRSGSFDHVVARYAEQLLAGRPPAAQP